MKTIAVDFDGVIHRYKYGYDVFDIPMDNAKESLEKILNQGWSIIIHSARPEESIKEWCLKNNFWVLLDPYTGSKYPGVWRKGVSYWAKPQAKFYIDDRAIRFVSWADVEKYVL